MTGVVDSFMVNENNDLIIYAQHCDTYDLVANCNIMLTNKVKNKNSMLYSTNHVYLHRPNAFGFWQTRLHLCYETLKRVSNFSELA